VTNTSSTTSTITTYLQEITTRNQVARDIIAGFSGAAPTLAEAWRHIEAALDDTPTLTTEIARLNAELRRARLGRANLAAAALAAIAAYCENESDPLSYLRDELKAQGYRADRDSR
jgi:hypothetical protein